MVTNMKHVICLLAIGLALVSCRSGYWISKGKTLITTTDSTFIYHGVDFQKATKTIYNPTPPVKVNDLNP